MGTKHLTKGKSLKQVSGKIHNYIHVFLFSFLVFYPDIISKIITLAT